MNISANFKRESGSSLIEVMIALFILAVGMLGVLAMQTNSVQVSRNAAFYSQATILATDMAEAMRTSPSVADNYVIAYDTATPADPGCATTTSDCDSADIANWNLHQWRDSVESLLPGGESRIVWNAGAEVFEISVRFVREYDEDTGQQVTGEVTLVTVL